MKVQNVETLKIVVWHVLEYDHFQVEDHSYGQFHEGDTYVIRWQYMICNAGMFHEGDTYVIRWQYMICNAGMFHAGDTYVIRWQYMICNAGMCKSWDII